MTTTGWQDTIAGEPVHAPTSSPTFRPQVGRHRKADTDQAIEDFRPRQLEANAVRVLPVRLRHALALAELPDLHRDPFDRMLVSGAGRGAHDVSGDDQVSRYPVNVVG